MKYSDEIFASKIHAVLCVVIKFLSITNVNSESISLLKTTIPFKSHPFAGGLVNKVHVYRGCVFQVGVCNLNLKSTTKNFNTNEIISRQ